MSAAIRNDSYYSNQAKITKFLKDIKKFVSEHSKCDCEHCYPAEGCDMCLTVQKIDTIQTWINKKREP